MTDDLLTENHTLKPILDSIFSSCSVIENPENFKAAGFQTISLRRRGALQIAKHPIDVTEDLFKDTKVQKLYVS